MVLGFFPFTLSDPTIILLIPAILLTLYAQIRVRSAFSRYSEVATIRRYSGKEAARAILDAEGLYDVDIEQIPGELNDHYDPRKRALVLSSAVYNGRSVAAVGVAAHEAGHAVQHASRYAPLQIRMNLVPLASLGSNLAWILFFIGLCITAGATAPFGKILMDIGIVLFSAVVLFQVVTLPVELNASKRALALLTERGVIVQEETIGVKQVLNAAALTYLAAMLMAILTLVRFLVLRSSSRE